VVYRLESISRFIIQRGLIPEAAANIMLRRHLLFILSTALINSLLLAIGFASKKLSWHSFSGPNPASMIPTFL
jgi:hypothetical protein